MSALELSTENHQLTLDAVKRGLLSRLAEEQLAEEKLVQAQTRLTTCAQRLVGADTRALQQIAGFARVDTQKEAPEVRTQGVLEMARRQARLAQTAYQKASSNTCAAAWEYLRLRHGISLSDMAENGNGPGFFRIVQVSATQAGRELVLMARGPLMGSTLEVPSWGQRRFFG
jgi:hypothetical protein